MKTLHLICNAHLDPMWLWELQEGAAEAISTFRVAAEFCERFGGFVFNHNEALLYRWIEEYEPNLFARIRELVKNGSWHIMGGWFLQPDCNMPAGESLARQIIEGRRYFQEKFGVSPTVAVNVDSFGHTRGLVQILKKSGFDAYLFCRPKQEDCPLPSDDFIWLGYDGSKVLAHRASDHYRSEYGGADEKIEDWIRLHPNKSEGLVLWGVGNHGGGPSRIDLQKIQALMEQNTGFELLHSTPEAYFENLQAGGFPLPEYRDALNPWAVGCYTSQIRIKQQHRLLENEFYKVEKMLSAAAIQGLLAYPHEDLKAALRALLLNEFHDILPGTSIQPVEEAALRGLAHGLEIVSQLKMKAFFALASGQPKAAAGEIPILVYNPHPFPVRGIFECEFQLPEQNFGEEFALPIVCQEGEAIPSQPEKELSNLNVDWRKRIAFFAELKPGQMNRFDCRLKMVTPKPVPALKAQNGQIVFQTSELKVAVNCTTGLVDEYVAHGKSFLKPNAFLPLVIEDSDDPWAMTVREFRKIAGKFQLLSSRDGTLFSGVKDAALDSVRIIEDGPVRTVIEAVLGYGRSFICQTYKLPKLGTEIEVEMRVYWNEKSKMLKLSLPTTLTDSRYLGQVAYGVENLSANGQEVVAQKWVAAANERNAFTCVNDGIYGSDLLGGEIRLSLLRSAAYAGHPILDRPIMPKDRFAPRMDQGERTFKFWLNGGKRCQRLEAIDREALIHNEKPELLSFFPAGEGNMLKPLAELSDSVVQMSAFKKAEEGDDYIIRLFNPAAQTRRTTLTIPTAEFEQQLTLGAYEIQTIRFNPVSQKAAAVDFMEQPANQR